MTAAEELALLAERALRASATFDPVRATTMGIHDYDDQVTERTTGRVEAYLRDIEDLLTGIDGVDDLALELDEQVDLEVLRSRLAAERFDLAEVRRHEWDPLEWDPSAALHSLATRDFAPADDRLRNAHARLRAVPALLQAAQETLTEMSAIHVETALTRLGGFDDVLDEIARLGPLDADAVDASRTAVVRHGSWLAERIPTSRRDPRLGVRLYSAAAWHHLDEEIAPVRILELAEAHLDDVVARLREVAAEYLGESERAPDVVRRALADAADRAALDTADVLPTIRDAMHRSADFVRELDLMSLPDQTVEIVDMPRIHRGIAVAYCDSPGSLEAAPLPAVVAVAPPPEEWGADQVRSFLREYNADLLHDLSIHEAVPGHAAQLEIARTTPMSLARRMAPSSVFIEGWAVYAEELLVQHGYRPDEDPRAHLRMLLQQLKMQARATLNAILDARVHGGDIDESAAIELLRRRGFQEETEARGKWRRALLTAAQLPTYFIGWLGVRQLIDDLRVLHPDWSDRRIHDLVLGHGSLGPRHLRAVLGL